MDFVNVTNSGLKHHITLKSSSITVKAIVMLEMTVEAIPACCIVSTVVFLKYDLRFHI